MKTIPRLGMEVLFDRDACQTTMKEDQMMLSRAHCRELVTEAFLISFSGGFLAWYVWAKIATYPWIT
ncbi:hypothetical protein TA3x_003092 [Tundrisphaera sp. TA3]|uniref:hypothetical protein n=1 Tax=Tundrisphaera sp. TA3 TaxID=3435775 RepID=UPI003EBAE176